MLRKTIITIAISAAISGALALAPVDAFARGVAAVAVATEGAVVVTEEVVAVTEGVVVVTEEVVVVTEGVGSPVVMLAGSAAAGSVAAGLVVAVSAVVQSVASAAGLAVSVQLR
jgi:hypothetical protein